MFKRLPLLCAALLALAACSHDNSDSGNAAPPVAPTTSTASTAAAPARSAPAAAAVTPFVDTGKWVAGKNYFVIDPAQPTSHPGKIEVTEVFSYGCPACNAFHSTVDQIARSLPAGAVMNYLPAAFRPDENWPVYQRAFYAAKALGLVEKTQDAMFDATWKTGELSTYNLKGNGLKPKEAWPTIDDMAKFYAKYGANPKEFVGIATSFSVNTQMKRADDLIKAYGVEGTPTMVVDGKYRFDPGSAGGYAQTIELTQWLVAKVAAGK
ncbi:MAG: thiol:disulfide interchange protein DsbA/DsbL [Pseudomonadota bacterium]|nr:thiol:disulfide interchange protein DsbA/DsbL [Pseudomonadota bacterium]